jgi:hypothetical protein
VTAHGRQVADWKTNFDDMKRMYEESKDAHEQTRDRWHADRVALAGARGERDALIQQVQQLQEALENKSAGKEIGGKERQTALKLIIGLAVQGYGYDPSKPRSPVFAEIASDLRLRGLSLDEDTIRKWLKNAAELLPAEALDADSKR